MKDLGAGGGGVTNPTVEERSEDESLTEFLFKAPVGLKRMCVRLQGDIKNRRSQVSCAEGRDRKLSFCPAVSAATKTPQKSHRHLVSLFHQMMQSRHMDTGCPAALLFMWHFALFFFI